MPVEDEDAVSDKLLNAVSDDATVVFTCTLAMIPFEVPLPLLMLMVDDIVPMAVAAHIVQSKAQRSKHTTGAVAGDVGTQTVRSEQQYSHACHSYTAGWYLPAN